VSETFRSINTALYKG